MAPETQPPISEDEEEDDDDSRSTREDVLAPSRLQLRAPDPQRQQNHWALRWLQQLLRSKHSGRAVATGIATLVFWIAYQKYKKKRKRAAPSYLTATHAPLSLLLALMDEGQLQKAMLGTSRIFFQSFNNNESRRNSWTRVDLPANPMLQKQLFARLSKLKSVDITALPEPDYTQWLSGALAVLPFAYLALVYRMMKNQFGDSDRNKHSFEHRQRKVATTFRDVAGLDSVVTEVSEIVHYLKDPERYHAIGASTPNGILLHGPPGTGKTLLAQAVAGEASVDCFLACSASDFVELYVGRGASRIRSLFKEVRTEALRRYKQRAGRGWLPFLFGRETTPCDSGTPGCSAILFIDELDALAKTRSTLGSNDEREQTLNQLLTEMEGFQKGDVTVIVMAATNRADVLDPAILRRFDRHIHVGYPDATGRASIIQVHAKRVAVEGAVDWRFLANETSGCSGAELRNMVNEAALLAVRERSKVTQRHFEEAAQKIQTMKTSLRSR